MKRFLIVDDSAFMRFSIKNILTKHGYEVIGEAENGRIATEKYRELSPDFVTLDITMEEMSGLEALKEIVGYDPGAKVLMVSAMGGQEWIIEEAMASGAKGFLTKPFREELVVSTIEKLYEQL